MPLEPPPTPHGGEWVDEYHSYLASMVGQPSGLFYPFPQKVPLRAEPRLSTSSQLACAAVEPHCFILLQHVLGSPPNSTQILTQALLLGESNPRPFWVEWGHWTLGGSAVGCFSLSLF